VVVLVAVGLLAGCLPGQVGLRAVIRTQPDPPRDPYPLTVIFDGSNSQGDIDQYVWTFQRADGQPGTVRTASGPVVTHTFPERGLYLAYLTVKSTSGGVHQAQVEVDVRSQFPQAQFSAWPTTLTVGDQITFDASASHDPDGEVVAYEWDFDDGTFLVSDQPQATHTYSAPGYFSVRLVVVDDYGDRSEPATLEITVVPGCPSCGR